MKKVLVRVAARGLAAVGMAATVLAFAGKIAGPYTLIVPDDSNPRSVASADCQARAATIGLVATKTLDDGRTEVVYRCEAE